MEDPEKSESERQDLLEKIEILKGQIRAFEGELGIRVEDLKNLKSEEESHVFHKMLESEEQLGVLEKLMKKEAQPPPMSPIEVKPAPIIFTPEPKAAPVASTLVKEIKVPVTPSVSKGSQEAKLPEAPHLELLPPEEKLQMPEKDLQASENLELELKEKSRQIAEISSMVSQLKESMQALKHEPPAEKHEEPAKTIIVKSTELSKEDLPLVTTLIEKLDNLIKSNQEVSTWLRELINENRNVAIANRIADLIKKLAQAGLNG